MKKIVYALFIAASLFLLAAAPTGAQDKNSAGKSGDKPLAYVIKLDGVISPASYDLISRHLKRAAKDKADIAVIEMHTPGGLYDSMQQIIQVILDSPVPVATFVSPAGSHAASAGTYILYGSHIAAMSPGTNLGAATPVQMGGSEPQKKDDTMPDTKDKSGKKDPAPKKNAAEPSTTLEQKMVNDASAYIRGLAELRKRNAEWAERAVREAESLTASEALSKKVIDVVAEDVPQLLKKIHGRTVKMAGGSEMKLNTANARIETFVPDWRHKLLEVITHPNVAFLLMTLGMYGLIYEFANPGALFPGIVGGICLLLGLFAMNVLPISGAGLALLTAGIGLMVAEALTPAFGILGVSGAIAFALGATMLIDSNVPGFGVDLWLIAAMTVTSFALLSIVLAATVRAQKRPQTTGREELLSVSGEVITWAKGAGEIRVTGEIWRAIADPQFILTPGDTVSVIAVNGLTLTVVPVRNS
jgi:membrane-bound serine protease (ClpP class)